MRRGVAAFALGVWLAQSQAALPGWPVLAAVALACALAIVGRVSYPRLRRLTGIVLLAAAAGGGFAWAAAAAKWRLADTLAPELAGLDLALTGVVANLPQPFERGVRFQLDVEHATRGSGNPVSVPAPGKVLLTWYHGMSAAEFQDTPLIRPGERWRLTARLRRPHGNANPHGFDYELWLLERGIGATGYVRPQGERVRLAAMVLQPLYVIERAREHIRREFWRRLADHRYAGVIVALAVGDQRAIEATDWETFTRTGVGHLMSISGLHVTMVSGLAGALVLWGWRRAPRLALTLAAPKAAAVAALVAAAVYALLAGFAVPAQRTLYMIAVVAVALWLNRMQSSSRVLIAALGVVLVIDPWAVTSPGFWLSFGAVGAILYVSSGAARRAHWLHAWGHAQWAVTVALAPLTLVLFQQVSLVAPLANAVAIPVVSFVVTPLALAAAVVPGAWLAELAHGVLTALMVFLDALAALPGGAWQQHAPAIWTVPFALAGAAWLLSPRGVPGRYAAPLLFLPMFAVRPAGPATGEVWVTFLDVGQGLAALVRTARHTLLYDAGPVYSPEADAGSRVVIPFLRGEGLSELDAVMVTHNDVDHSGGASAVMRTLPVRVLWSSFTPPHAMLDYSPIRLPCRAGVSWRWDGVSFELLHPPIESYDMPALKTNSRSCVLRVATSRDAVLLTADIEERDERRLLGIPDALKAYGLLVPHHGSSTSSSAAFIAAVKPTHAVFPVGYRNRYGHPHPDVLARYEAAGATIWRTDRDGAVTLKIAPDRTAVGRFRDQARRYWRE